MEFKFKALEPDEKAATSGGICGRVEDVLAGAIARE